MDNEKIYETRDLYLAATLITLKFPMLGTSFQYEGNKGKAVGYFRFNDTPMIRNAVQKYMQSLLTVEPRLYATNMRALKSEVIGQFSSPQNIK